MDQWLLFFHLVGAICFFSGGIVAGTLQVAAMRRERPSEILTLLRLTRVGVLLVGVGALLTLGFGIGLASNLDYGFRPAWIQAALGLWVASMAAGGAGGRVAREARHRAEQLAAAGDVPDDRLRELVAHRPSIVLNSLSGLMLVAILALMVWRPA